METVQLQYFTKVCEYGSISKAARSLHITPQAVSKSIASLEQEVGYNLLIRSSDGCVPTEKGLEVQRISARLQLFQQETVQQIYALDNRNRKTVAEQTVHIGVWLSFVTIMPASDFSDFNMLYPQIQLCVHSYPDIPSCEQALIDGNVELAFCSGATEGCGFTCLQKYDSSVYLVVNSKNPLANRRQVSLSELQDEKLIADYLPDGSGVEFEEELNRSRITPTLILPWASDSLKRSLVLDNNYAAFSYCPTGWLPYGLVPLRITDLSRYEGSDFSRATNHQLSDAAQLFADYIIPRFKKDIFGI